MKGAADRADIGQVLPVLETIAVLDGAAAAVVASPSEPRSDPRPAIGLSREFDDIPSVVRALLVGYDEV
jgi:hypothetical protein